MIVGWPNQTMPNDVIIRLTGNHNTPDFPVTPYWNLGAKALGIFGLVSMHGRQHTLHWTRLASTLENGATTLTMEEAATDWEVGNEIVVTTTSFESLQTEKFIIRGITAGGRTLTLNNPAKYTHTAYRTTTGGRNVTMSAKVGLLTRNIRIEGADDPAGSLQNQSFGCRVLVSQYSRDGVVYKGRARFSEVQFSHCGQLGYTEKYDPRYEKYLHI